MEIASNSKSLLLLRHLCRKPSSNRNPTPAVAGGMVFGCCRAPRSRKIEGPYLSLHAKSTEISPTAAVVNDATTMPSDYTEEQTSLQSQRDNDASHEDWRKKDREREHQKGPSNHEYQKMIRVCNKLIEVFMVDKPTTTDWRRLLAFSREWSSIRPHVFRRCEEQADSEQDPDMRHKLLRLGRKMTEIDEDVQKHNELLEMIKGAPSEINSVVARRRKDFTKEFFMHLHNVTEAYYDNPTEQNNLAKLGNTCLAAVQAFDTASESIEALNTAELKFQDIINSPTLDAACKKIDALAEKKELDSALMLMLTKAYSASKESNMMKDEVKDILYHLYMTGLGNLQRNIPKEIRIMKYILTIEDPEEKLCALKDAFTPGIALEGKNVDNLSTTPEKLYTWIRTVLDAYQFSREGSLIREARDLMNPKIIKKLEELKKLVESSFM
ncbi:uncharacterized protein At4g37920-like [Aristolochia californica]|uniref:uncharacterized protein At4g37920-like n=1 Tax=Aristolochia californica TaxID=171875 RepID=UPI0035D67626